MMSKEMKGEVEHEGEQVKEAAASCFQLRPVHLRAGTLHLKTQRVCLLPVSRAAAIFDVNEACSHHFPLRPAFVVRASVALPDLLVGSLSMFPQVKQSLSEES